jgi:predicted transcriptional regulator
MAHREYDLGSAELDVLKVLWDAGPGTVRAVMTELHGRGRHIAYTTVQTLLNRLEQKGYVTSDKSDLAFVFRARLTKERVRRSRLKALVEKLYDGAPGSLVLHLVKTERLSPNELTELQQLIERLDAQADRPPR